MYLLPILAIAVVAYLAYTLVRKRRSLSPSDAASTTKHITQSSRRPSSFWPSSTFGKVAIAIFLAGLFPIVLPNVVQVPYLGWGLQIFALVCLIVARFIQRDKSPSVLILLCVSALGVIAALLFVLGEVFIGHD